jgi:hypothetical protein
MLEEIRSLLTGDAGPEVQQFVLHMAAGAAAGDLAHKARGANILKKLAENTGEE